MMIAAMSLACGSQECVVAGGMESMSLTVVHGVEMDSPAPRAA